MDQKHHKSKPKKTIQKPENRFGHGSTDVKVPFLTAAQGPAKKGICVDKDGTVLILVDRGEDQDRKRWRQQKKEVKLKVEKTI